MRNLVEGRNGAILGAVLSAIGTFLAAYVLFPEDPTPRGALVVSGSILSIAILTVPAMRVLAQSPATTNAESFVALGFVFWLLLDLIQGAYALDEAKPESLRLALIAIGVSATAMWVGSGGKPWRAPAWVVEGINRPIDVNTIAAAVPICFLLGMFNFAYSVDFDIPLMFSYIGQQRWAVPWGRNQLGGWEAFRDQAPYFGYVLPSLAAVQISRRGLFSAQSLFAIFCAVIMLLFLSTGGGRRIIGVAAGAGLIVWVQMNPGLRFKNVIVVTLGAFALAWTAQFMLNVRTYGYQDYLQRGSDYDYLHVDDNFLRLAQAIEVIPAKRDYVTYHQIVFTMVKPIPRVLWPGKPVDAGFDLASEMGMRGLSLSMSIIGEWYISWGWIAVVFGGWFHGRLASTANSLKEMSTRSGNPIVYALSVMVLMAGMRSMQELVLMSYALVAWWAVSRYMAPTPALAR
jgi:hypothetical protein